MEIDLSLTPHLCIALYPAYNTLAFCAEWVIGAASIVIGLHLGRRVELLLV